VTFTVDAYMEDNFEGTVSQIRMKPTTTSNVVTYTVIIDAPNPDQKLFPGMTASVTIITEEQTGLAVPAEAFNFTPDEAVMKAMRKPENPEGRMPEPPQGERPQMEGRSMADHSMVWVKKGDNILPCPVKAGMSDGAYRIIEQGVQVGDSVVLSAQYVVKEKAVKKGENPFMPGPPGRNKNNSKGNKAPSGPPQ
jgi:HlyD family secretion protein